MSLNTTYLNLKSKILNNYTVLLLTCDFLLWQELYVL
jgi:hypothetical protein